VPGVAPKLPEQRRRRNAPERGEWVDLEPLEEPVLGPFNREWMTCRERTWNAWRSSPVTSQYGPEDIDAIEDLAREWAEMTYADRDRRLDKLGLTPKGKRDLRWRTPNEVKTIKKQAAKANVAKLHAVGKK
jgi:hypothetical protein